MINKLKIYISDSFNPYYNLATEKYLLNNNEEDCCTLFLWQNEKTVVIGRNQNPWVECNCSQLEEEGGHLARRLSGGGAVFHDLGNLNFTFLYNTKNHDLNRQLSVISKACDYAGISTEISGRNDILAGGKKFSGNAFYNSKGNSYHHGTILISSDMELMRRYLTPSQSKLEAKGIKSVQSRTINLSEISSGLTCEEMKKNMVRAFLEIYNAPLTNCNIIDEEEVIKISKELSDWNYLYGSTIPFSFSLEERFNWGQVNLGFQIEGGIITSIKVFTDSMDWELSDKIENSLLNSKFELNSIKKNLKTNLSSQISDDIIYMIKKATEKS